MLAGWQKYANLDANTNGPFLARLSETVFQTNAYAWSTEWAGVLTNPPDKVGHLLCMQCMTNDIDAGCDDIMCVIQPGDFIIASFRDHILHGGTPKARNEMVSC